MANNFIGLCMLVTLTSPPGAQVEGTVSGIEPGKSLTLSNVICPSTGKFTQELTLKAIDIQELKEVTSEETSSERITSQKSNNTMESKTFTDPAILSVGKRPIPNERSPMNTLESNSSWEQVTKPDNNDSNNKISVASLVNHTKDISLADVMNEDLVHVKQHSIDTNYVSQSSRVDLKSKNRYQKHKLRKAEGDKDKDKEIMTNLTNPISKSKGWRQTPLLEPNPSFQPFSNLKRNGKGKREEEGWGTEDATDVQELGDFDFEGGLAKFDKNRIFNQFEAEDGIAAKDRLVSFNRVRSSNFGKNLPSSKNVIDESWPTKIFSKSKSDNWIESPKDANVTQKTSHKEAEISRHARHVETKINNNRRPIDIRSSSRKDSANCSLSSSRNYSVSRVASNPGFYTLLFGHRCDPVSPLQMLNLENIATNELGLSEDILTENAGRSIAEIAFSAVSKSRNLITRSNSTLNSTVVALVGNNKSGLRAVATARHIKNHGFNVILCIVGLEQESELLASLKSQIKIFRNIGGKVISKVELFEFSKQLDAPIDLIIDGLIGLAISFEELRLGEQSTIYELIAWANNSKAEVLAIDVPTGIDPTNGEVSIIDGRPLYLYPNYVVALGAPKKGLLEAMSLGYGAAEEKEDSRKHNGKRNSTNEWQLFVADIGLGEAVWKKAGSKIRRGIEFDENWVIKIRFKGLDE